jgi:hypothetical protein
MHSLANPPVPFIPAVLHAYLSNASVHSLQFLLSVVEKLLLFLDSLHIDVDVEELWLPDLGRHERNTSRRVPAGAHLKRSCT